MNTKFLEAIAILVGATIGAGVLGIPYVVSEAGFWTGIFVIIGLGIATLIINLYMGEVALRTNGNHQLSGYAEKYTGRIGKELSSAFMIFGIYGALIAYTMGVGEAAATIFHGNSIIYSLAFFIIGSLIVYKGIKSLGKAELLIASLLIIVVILIPILSSENLNPDNLQGFNLLKIMGPYGVVLFAFMGTPAIPMMKEELKNNRKLLKKAIIIGTLIPLIVYLLFTFIVVGIVGNGFQHLPPNGKIATIALSNFVRPEIWVMANVFAMLTMTTSFLALTYALWSTYQYDYNLKKSLALFLTLSIPFAVFMINSLMVDAANFVNILSIVGAITGGITGVLIVVMHYKARKKGDRKPEYNITNSLVLGVILSAVFVAGIIKEIVAIFL